VQITQFSGGITNSGTISAGADGIVVGGKAATGFSVTISTFTGGIVNSTGGTISAGHDGIVIGSTAAGGGTVTVSDFSGGVVNAGTIKGNSIGIDIDNVLTFSNGITNTGTISAGTGIELTNTPDVSVFDSGVITGTGGTAIQFDGPSDNTLTLAAGYSITGSVFGGGTDTLQLGGTGSASFDLSDVGTQYTGFSTFNVIGGTWTATGSGSDWNVEGGTFKVSGTASDTTIDSGGTMEVLSGGSATGSIDFDGAGGVLKIDGATLPTDPATIIDAAVSGFAVGDTIDLTGIAYSTPNSATVNGSDVLQITEGGFTYDLQLIGDYTGDTFVLSPDSAHPAGTDVNIACYRRGTLILTQHGQKPVEELKIGDQIMTMSGVARPIKWIGRRSYSGRFIMGRKNVLPVCIKAGALEDSVPERDLWISPNHAMYLDGLLIEAKDLINGASIMQAESVDSLEYFHLELDSHDVLIAEGAPSETFIDDDSRGIFHNAHEYRTLYPQQATAELALYCAPRLADGYEVEAVRRRIALRAGLRPRDQETRIGMVRGSVDLVSTNCIAGWAQNMDHPEAPVCLDIYAGGLLIGQVLANHYREDLEQAGIGSGRHSFEFMLPDGLAFAPGAVEVRRSLDGVTLEFSAEGRWALKRFESATKFGGEHAMAEERSPEDWGLHRPLIMQAIVPLDMPC
jgi:autotransporter passenger strand-loop-strand repeat protein